MLPIDLARNISDVTARIRAAEAAAGRAAGSVRLLAVSKTKPSSVIAQASEYGLLAFGENYAQEMAEKALQLADLALDWHFIGPIQANKSKLIAEACDWVHSIDRVKVARKLNEQRDASRDPLQVLIQVNVSGETSKSGVQPEEVAALADAIMALPRLTLRGLMAIPAPVSEGEDPRKPFAALRHLRDDLIGKVGPLDTLSMGMSADLEAAILEGSTLVRVGTDIFGARYT